jgi:hypothetical protein
MTDSGDGLGFSIVPMMASESTVNVASIYGSLGLLLSNGRLI